MYVFLSIVLAVILFIAYTVYLHRANRKMPWLIHNAFAKSHLAQYQWYRKWYGGYWERWYIEMCHSLIWLDVPRQFAYPDYCPGSGHGIPEIEDYGDTIYEEK